MDRNDQAAMVSSGETSLTRMGAAEGSAALMGLARLCEALVERGLLDQAAVSSIRDAMVRSLDPSNRPEDAGLGQAYSNAIQHFDFLASPAPPKGQPS